MDILDIARLNQQRAWKVVEDSGVIPAWESIGAEINLVGSLSTGLLMTHRDIDFHIYTSPLELSAKVHLPVPETRHATPRTLQPYVTSSHTLFF